MTVVAFILLYFRKVDFIKLLKSKKTMTGIEGEKFKKPKPKEKKEPSLTEKEKKILFGEVSWRGEYDKFMESLTEKEKEIVQDWWHTFGMKKRTIEEIEKARRQGDIITEEKETSFLEKDLPRMEISLYEKMYSIIKETALKNIGLGSKLSEETEKIFKEKTKIHKLMGRYLKDVIPRFPLGFSKLYVEGYVEKLLEEQKEISLREAVNKVEAGLSPEEKSKYDDECFKGRLRLSKAIKLRES